MVVLKCSKCGRSVKCEHRKDLVFCEKCYDLVYQELLDKRFDKLLNVLLEHERVAPPVDVGA